jgi:hypothetical protein
MGEPVTLVFGEVRHQLGTSVHSRCLQPIHIERLARRFDLLIAGQLLQSSCLQSRAFRALVPTGCRE